MEEFIFLKMFCVVIIMIVWYPEALCQWPSCHLFDIIPFSFFFSFLCLLMRVPRAFWAPDFPLGLYSSLSHTHQEITRRNLLGVAPRCWLEKLNSRLYGSHETLGIARPIPWGLLKLVYQHFRIVQYLYPMFVLMLLSTP